MIYDSESEFKSERDDKSSTPTKYKLTKSSSYSGQNFIESDIPFEDFKINQSPPEPNFAATIALNTLSTSITEALRTGFFDSKIYLKWKYQIVLFDFLLLRQSFPL